MTGHQGGRIYLAWYQLNTILMRTTDTSVILIDDDPCTLAMTKRVVDGIITGRPVAAFCTAADALKYLEREGELFAGEDSAPGIILSDLHMPYMDGWRFLDEFASLSWAVRSRYSVFILSSTEDKEEKARLVEKRSFAGFCSKPLTSQKFMRLLTEMYSK